MLSRDAVQRKTSKWVEDSGQGMLVFNGARADDRRLEPVLTELLVETTLQSWRWGFSSITDGKILSGGLEERE